MAAISAIDRLDAATLVLLGDLVRAIPSGELEARLGVLVAEERARIDFGPARAKKAEQMRAWRAKRRTGEKR